ncbi:MAG: hypothetical protein E7111_06745 [Bacteroidales bacterium]|nr:hypothetical protein [Bacteroidales bacterium]
MKNIIMSLLVICFSAHMTLAQNIDPTIEVTRGYKAELVDIHKPVMEMSVPDSVYRFDLDFDYSVFESPYGGSYEFSPYTVSMKPQVARYKSPVLYLNAGAGYTLHPTLDLIYSPDLKGRFGVNVGAHHQSYVGGYRAPHIGSAASGVAGFKGYDIQSDAGADFTCDWDRTALDFGVSYYGVAVSDFLHKDDFNALDARISVKSKLPWTKAFMYDVSAAYRFGGDSHIREHLVGLDVRFGPPLKAQRKLFFDMGGNLAAYQKGAATTFAGVYVLPHYVFQKNWFKADMGLRLSYAASTDKNPAYKHQYAYPDVRLSCLVGKDVMRLYMNVTGGETLNTYSSLLERNHHFHSDYALAGSAALGWSQVRVKPEIGFEGRITKFFSYDIKGGYSLNAASPFEAIVRAGEACRPAVGYTDNQQCYAEFDWALALESFRFDGTLKYTHTWGVSAQPENVFLVRPSEWNLDCSAVYNWKKRLYAGVDCEYASSRKTSDAAVYVPYYVDLGVFAEYAFNRKISVWLRGGNLLDMEIQRNVLFAEKGINFTAGICLILQ